MKKIILTLTLFAILSLCYHAIKSERKISALKEENGLLKIDINTTKQDLKKTCQIMNKIYLTNEKKNKQINLKELNNRLDINKINYTTQQIIDNIKHEFDEFSFKER